MRSVLKTFFVTSALCAPLVLSTAVQADEGGSQFEGSYLGAYIGIAGAEFKGYIDSSEFPDTEYSEIFDGDDGTGSAYGLYAGHNFFQGGWMVGIEADIGSGDISERAAEEATPSIEYATHDVDWYGSVRGRFGTTVMDDAVLIFGTAGVGYIQSEFTSYNDLDDPDPEIGSADLDSITFVLGAGAETKWNEHWSVRGEFLYYGATERYEFRQDQLTDDQDAGDYAQIDGMYILRLGVAYHF